MADNTHSIKVSGGQYTDIQTWIDDTDVVDFEGNGPGRWIGEIQDNSEYADESLVFSLFTGTPDADNFAWLTVAPANRHAGVYDTGKAILSDSSGHVITVSEEFVVLEYLQIKQNGSTNSDECIRCSADNLLVSRSILRGMILTGGGAANQDGIYVGDNDATYDTYIDNCVFYNFPRAGIHAQNGSTGTVTFHVDSCSLWWSGHEDTSDAGSLLNNNNDATAAFNVYNTWALEPLALGRGDAHCYENNGGGTHTWAGSNNIADDDSAESKFTSSYDDVILIATDPASGENVYVTSKSTTVPDFNIVDEDTETVTQNGVDRSSTHPAPQTTDGATKVQDLATDIKGVSRGSSWSIGAFQFPAAAVPGSILRQAHMKRSPLLRM